MNKVVMTSITVKLTVRAASKKNCLKNVVAYTIPRSSEDGRYVVRTSLVKIRLNTISIFNPWPIFPVKMYKASLTKESF